MKLRPASEVINCEKSPCFDCSRRKKSKILCSDICPALREYNKLLDEEDTVVCYVDYVFCDYHKVVAGSFRTADEARTYLC